MEDVLMRLVPLMFGAVVAMIAWIGKRLHDKMDQLSEDLGAHRYESEKRITRVETAIEHMETRLEHIETKLR